MAAGTPGRSIVMNRLRASRVFYGWYVVAAAFAVTFVGFGSAYTFSAFVEPLQRDFAASRGQISLVFSLAGFLYFGFGIVSGPLADRFGSRRLAVAGMLLTAAGLAAAGAARTLLQVYAAYGLGVGLGVGCAYVPAVGAVQRWFVRRRGFASGLAVAGIGVGTLAMPPLASALIAHLGWRGAYFTLAAIAVVLGAGMSLLIENDPRGRGLLPDGDVAREPAGHPRRAGDRRAAHGHAESGATVAHDRADAPAVAAVSAPAGASMREAVMSRPFASLYAACLVCSFGVFVPFVHLVPYAVDRGVAPTTAVRCLARSASAVRPAASFSAASPIASAAARRCSRCSRAWRLRSSAGRRPGRPRRSPRSHSCSACSTAAGSPCCLPS